MPPIRMRLLLALVLVGPLFGCAEDESPPPQSFVPLTYGYLRPLRLNVGSIETVDELPTTADGNLVSMSPVNASDALRQMAQDRLVAAGAGGHAVFTIQQASILPAGDMLNGMLKVRLDITTSAGQRAAYAEAAVARSVTGPSSDDGMRPALYALTRQMMSDMNVELEFQLRRTLGDWLQTGPGGVAPPPAPVQQQALPPPPPAATFRLVPSVPPGR